MSRLFIIIPLCLFLLSFTSSGHHDETKPTIGVKISWIIGNPKQIIADIPMGSFTGVDTIVVLICVGVGSACRLIRKSKKSFNAKQVSNGHKNE